MLYIFREQQKLAYIIIKRIDPRLVAFFTDKTDHKGNIIIDKISSFHFYGNSVA